MNERFIRLIILSGLIAMFWLVISVLPVHTKASSSELFLPGELILKLRQAGDLATVAEDYSLDPAPLDQFGSRSLYRLRILDGMSPRDKAAALIADPQGRVVYADPNFIHEAPEGRARVIYAGGGGDGEYVGQWAPGKIRLPEAHAITRGAGITVAVIDTGVDLSHPALVGRLVPGYDFVDDDADPSEEGAYGVNDLFGHGTHVAGLIALAAPDSRIMPLRVLNPDGVGNIWVLAEALAYALDPDGNPETDDGADVVNLSLSTLERSGLLRDVVKAVTCADPMKASPDDLPCFLTNGRGAVVVMAAGNGGNSVKEYPAGDGIAGTISVAASTQGDTLASFSNYGSWVNVAAPGEGIWSTVPGGGYGNWSGTSMATPLVSGEAALVRAAFPRLNTVKVAKQIATKTVDIGGEVKNRIDAATALNLKQEDD
jgi:subtilisin family serine protease